MRFCDLLKCLLPVTGKGNNGTEHVAEVISMLTSVPEDKWNTRDDPSVLASDETKRKIFSSDRSFTKKLANAIFNCIDLSNFISVIDNAPVPAKRQVVSCLDSHGMHDVDVANVGVVCAQIAQEFLIKKAKLDIRPETAARNLRIANATAKNTRALYLQARGCASCGRSLSVAAGSNRAPVSEIVLIDANCADPGFDDFVVMCPQCATSYQADPSLEEQKRIRATKAKLTSEEALLIEAMVPLNLERQLADLLSKVSQLTAEQLPAATSDPNYDPVAIEAKIKNHPMLQLQVRDAMTTYFATMHSYMSDLEIQNKLHFRLLSNQMNGRYLELAGSSASQPDTFDALTQWVQKRTGHREHVCAVLVSYFVQICEVFEVQHAAS